MALFIVDRVGTGFTVRPGDNALQAAASALKAQSWAEGTLPGGAGTKSAKEWAGDSAASAATAEAARDVSIASSVQYPTAAAAVAGLADGAFGSYLDGDGNPVWGQRVGASMVALPGPWIGADKIGSNDGASGTLWTTVAGFITRLMSSAGASVIGFIQAGTGATARTVQSKLRDVVSVKDFGAVGDGAADDSTAFVRALARGGTITLRGGETYFGNSTVITPTVPVIIDGNGATLIDFIFGSNGAASVDGVTFRNIKFTTAKTPNAAQLPPHVINSRNIENLIIEGCTFENVMAYLATDDTNLHYGPTVRDCTFKMIGTGWNWTGPQLDMLTVSGYRHPLIENNKFFATDVNRFLKISVGLTIPLTPVGSPVPVYNTRGITVRRNWFSGNCQFIGGLPGGKQVIDCFSGTTESTFEGNYFNCTGFSRCIENKTGYAYADSNIVTSHKILNNRFYLDCAAVFFQGAYGLTTYTPNSRDTLHLSGNTYRVSLEDEGTVQVRFMNLLTLDVGEDASVSAPIVNKMHYDISSCEEIKLIGVNSRGGNVVIGNSTSNAQGDSFTARVRRITLRDVSVLDWGNGQTVDTAGIMINGCTGLESINIEGCKSITSFDDANMLSAFWIRACGTVPKVIVCGNVAEHSANAAKEYLRVTDSNVSDRFVETGNSWVPAVKDLANVATPSIKPTASGGNLTNGGNVFQTGGGTAITDILDAYVGQTITIYANQNCTITNGTAIRLNGGVNFAMTLYDTLVLYRRDSVRWVELSRSVN